jgi:hypothetical protein
MFARLSLGSKGEASMFRVIRLCPSLALLVLLVCVLPTHAQQAFTAKGEGNYTDNIPVDGGTLLQYLAAGIGSPTGKFTASGQHVVTNDGYITDGQLTLKDFSGNQIFLSYSGTINDDGDFVVTGTVFGGTGQFQGATGDVGLHGQDWGLGMFGLIVNGTISY